MKKCKFFTEGLHLLTSMAILRDLLRTKRVDSQLGGDIHKNQEFARG